MKADSQPESPTDNGDIKQKQDPLERRRLQNRLSQRNHRRKIRDRIAKLQERVIANELRAAAVLNGWDQNFAASPPMNTRQGLHGENDYDAGSLDPAYISPEQYTPFTSSISGMSSWESGMAVCQSPGRWNGDATCFFDVGHTGDPGWMNTMNSCGPFMSTTNSSVHNTESRDFTTSGGAAGCDSSGHTVTQPLYYVATENALPQILQRMKSAPSHSNVIVILPVPTTGYPSPTSNPLGSNNIESMPAAQPNVGNLSCQCQVQNVHSVSGARVSRTWRGL